MALTRKRRVPRRPRLRRGMRRRGRGIKGVNAGASGSAAFTLPYPALDNTYGVRTFRRRKIAPRTRKRRGGAMTQTLRKRLKFNDGGGYNQWLRYKFYKTLGRSTINKRIESLTEKYDFTWRRFNELRQQGALFMPNWQEVTANADRRYRPIYLVELNSAIVGGSVANPVMNLVRQMGNETLGTGAANSNYQFAPVLGLTATGGTQTGWVAVVSDTATSSSLSKRSMLNWSEIRLDLWGARARPTEYTLTLCQFDERVLPEHGNTFLLTKEGIDWWDDVCAKLITNPNIRKPNTGGTSNMMRVMDRKTFMINPQSTTEEDTDPTCKTVRLFYKMNRMCNWDWRKGAGQAYTVDVDNAGDGTFQFINPPIKNQAQVHPKARVFLMITAANYAGTVTGNTQTNVNYPSINLSVYNRWTDF